MGEHSLEDSLKMPLFNPNVIYNDNPLNILEAIQNNSVQANVRALYLIIQGCTPMWKGLEGPNYQEGDPSKAQTNGPLEELIHVSNGLETTIDDFLRDSDAMEIGNGIKVAKIDIANGKAGEGDLRNSLSLDLGNYQEYYPL